MSHGRRSLVVAAGLAIALGAAPARACVGDCDGNGAVSIAELIGGVRIALGLADVRVCRALDANGNAGVEIDELVLAVANAARGCATGVNPFPPPLRDDATLQCAPRQRFYDMCVDVLSVFGQRDAGEASEGQPTANSQIHAPGVIVDRSPCDGAPCPNKIYVVDGGNNRILGYRSLGHCVHGGAVGVPCTNDRDCAADWSCHIEPQLAAAAIAIGQADFAGSSCNRDSNIGMNGPAAADTLCFAEQPGGANRAEFWRRINIDVDDAGNLYVPDVQNNRVLKFNQPLSRDYSGGKGDGIPDFVWGQPDMQSNTPGTSLASLHLTSVDEPTVILAWGVSSDGAGGVWVADTLNRRVLHFAADSKTADAVLGHGAGPCGRTSYDVCYPLLARQDGDALWVLDENPADGLPFSSRFVVFNRAGGRWVGAAIHTPLSGYRRESPPPEPAPTPPASAEIFQATGFVFKPRLPGVRDPYPSGYVWVNEHEANRTLLIDRDGAIVTAIGGIEQPPGSRKYTRGCNLDDYARCGQAIGRDPRMTGAVADYRLCWPGGSIGIDSANNIYLADEALSGVVRFALPYVPTLNPISGAAPATCAPDANGGLSGRNLASDARFGQGVGLAVSNPSPAPPQLVVRSANEYLAWNGYGTVASGAAADVIIGRELDARAFHAVDDHHRLWTSHAGKLIVYQLPLTSASVPIRPGCPGCAVEPESDSLSLQWADDHRPADYTMNEWNGIAFDAADPAHQAVWVAEDNRILRIGNYDRVGREPLRVDLVIGQVAKTQRVNGVDVAATFCNRDPASADRVGGIQPLTIPAADTVCQPTDLAFDRRGNLFVVEGSYECVWSGNNRVSVFTRADIAAAVARGDLFPDIGAQKVFVAASLTDSSRACSNRPQAPGHPVTIAFDHDNHLVLANDGTSDGSKRDRALKQLWFYKDPLAKWVRHPHDAALNGRFVQQQMPDAAIRLPMGVPGEMAFDSMDNLLIQDHTWEKVWLLNLGADIDPLTGWSKWLVATQWDADGDGVVNLYDPSPYGEPFATNRE
jgi:hypothetical protein